MASHRDHLKQAQEWQITGNDTSSRLLHTHVGPSEPLPICSNNSGQLPRAFPGFILCICLHNLLVNLFEGRMQMPQCNAFMHLKNAKSTCTHFLLLGILSNSNHNWQMTDTKPFDFCCGNFELHSTSLHHVYT